MSNVSNCLDGLCGCVEDCWHLPKAGEHVVASATVGKGMDYGMYVHSQNMAVAAHMLDGVLLLFATLACVCVILIYLILINQKKKSEE